MESGHAHKPRALKPSTFRLVYESMLELAVFHEVVYGPGGEATDYRILECNPAFSRITGITRDRAVGHLASEVYGSVPYLDVYARVAQTGAPERFDTYFPPLDRHFSISVVCPRRGTFVTIASDVTERERHLESLRRYRILAESAHDIILFVRRADGRILDANGAAATAYGYTGEQLLALTVFDLRANSTMGVTAAQMATADEAGLRFETVHKRKDGSTFSVEVSSIGTTLDGVRVLVSVVRDISERKEAEARVASERERLAVTLRSIGDAVIATDRSSLVTLMNPVAEALTGWRTEEAIGKPLKTVFDIVDEHTGVPAVDPVDRVLREGRVVELANHTLLRAKNASERPVADSGAPIRDASGQVVGVVLVFRDQSKERRAEEERARLNAQLAEAQKLESVGRLAGGIAHDFNNLLTIILSCAELLSEQIRDGSVARAEDVRDIAEAGARARDLTNRLLTFARKQSVTLVPLDLNKVVRGVEGLLRRALGEGYAILPHLQEDLWAVRGDKHQIEQVIMNLVLNGRDAMPVGGKLDIETANVAGDPIAPGAGDRVRLTVRDAGTGMAPEVQRHLFEPFFTTKPRGKGTGLGLATVSGIVGQAGGQVQVESEPGRGTSVHAIFPRTHEPLPSEALDPPAPRRSGGETVLVVEDDPQVREVAVRALRAAGYVVLVAEDAREGIELALSQPGPIHLLVTDVVMPGADGVTVAKAFHGRHPGARILFVSGYAQEAIAKHGLVQEDIELLSKPYTPSLLLGRVRSLLEDGEEWAG